MDYRGKLIRIVTFLGGLYFFLEFVLPSSIGGVKIDAYHDQISNGFTAIGAAAIGLGLINLLMVHGSKLLLLRRGWFESLGLLLGLFLMSTVTASEWYLGYQQTKPANQLMVLREFAGVIEADAIANRADRLAPSERIAALVSSYDAERPSFIKQQEALNQISGEPIDLTQAQAIKQNVEQVLTRTDQAIAELKSFSPDAPQDSRFAPLKQAATEFAALATASREASSFLFKRSALKGFYELLYQGIFVSLGSAMFALLGFYIAAAAYRAFRIRSAESALMMTAALLVMLGQIPFGIWLWDAFPDIRLWLLSVPNSAAFRAIKIGAAVAGLVMAFRMWFSIESQSFAERSKGSNSK